MKYLSKSVKDKGKKGISSIEEVKGILKQIEKGLKKDYNKTISRVNLLSLVITKEHLRKHSKKRMLEMIESYRLNFIKQKKTL